MTGEQFAGGDTIADTHYYVDCRHSNHHRNIQNSLKRFSIQLYCTTTIFSFIVALACWCEKPYLLRS
jgi:hypothetical protein